MKYIRTNDGVYEIERYFEPLDYYWVKQDCDEPIASVDIIAKSDSIKELCDCYALEDCLDPIRGLFLFKSFTFAKRAAEERNERLFGYIIIEKKGAKALEPVAVLNDEGELELL